MEKFIAIGNRGPEINQTNFWRTEMAHNGYAYASINSGCLRLLLPQKLMPTFAGVLPTTKYVVMSREPTPPTVGRVVVQLLFEDGTDTPFAIGLGIGSIDRSPALYDAGRKFKFHVYANQSPMKIFESDLYFNVVSSLPCYDRIDPTQFRL